MTVIAVIGAGEASPGERRHAYEVGLGLAHAGATIVCGGLGGVMEAACRGAREAGGRTVGLLPGRDRADANPFVDVALPTGLGEARNVLVVRAADAVVAIGGSYGTLSEMALALKAGLPVVGLDTWPLERHPGAPDPVVRAADARDAVDRVLSLARSAS